MIIYKTTNLINNKLYIGQTSVDRLKCIKYYKGGGTIIKQAFKKYGRKNFKCEILVEGNFNQLLTDELEKHYIRLYNSNNQSVGYNIEPGGFDGSRGMKRSQSCLEKLSKAAKGRIPWNKGKPCSKKTKAKISKANKGKPIHENSLKAALNNRKKTWSHKDKEKASLRMSQPILQYSEDNKLIKEWPSVKIAAKELSLGAKYIYACTNNKKKAYWGFKWKKKNG